MKKILLPVLLHFILVGGLLIIFNATVQAQLINPPNCTSLARSPSPCLNADGTTRPPNTYGDCPLTGGSNETCYDTVTQSVRQGQTGQQVPPGQTGARAIRNEAIEKVCAQIAEQPGGIEAAARNSIVPCGAAVHQCTIDESDDTCGFTHLFILVNKIVTRFITIVFAPLLTIVLMYIGFLFIKDKAGAKTKAKELLMRVLVGTFFVLASWLIVHFLLLALGADGGLTKFLGN